MANRNMEESTMKAYRAAIGAAVHALVQGTDGMEEPTLPYLLT